MPLNFGARQESLSQHINPESLLCPWPWSLAALASLSGVPAGELAGLEPHAPAAGMRARGVNVVRMIYDQPMRAVQLRTRDA